jgi:uncharacterized protein with gpF-like domain
MALDLTALARQRGKRRNLTLRPIQPTQAQATDLALILAPAWQVWRDALDRIMAGYDPPPLTGDMLTLDSPAQIQSTFDATAADFISRLVATITPGLRRYAVRLEQWHRSKWAAAVKAATDVDLSTILTAQPVSETLDVWLARNVALVKNISEQAQGRISDAVFNGFQQRLPAREVAKAIREATGMARDRSVRIASDQSSKLSAALDRERQAEAGITLFRWRSSHKLHPRSWHAARDGKVFELKSGKPYQRAGEAIPADDRAGVPPFCGCREQAYLPIMDEPG